MAARAWERLVGAACGLALVFGLSGCAPSQRVPLHLEPASAAIYVDGERLEGSSPAFVELRSDRAHVLFFKQEGYRPQQVVLSTEPGEAGPRLVPDRVSVTLERHSTRGRSLRIEVDDPAAASAGPASATTDE